MSQMDAGLALQLMGLHGIVGWLVGYFAGRKKPKPDGEKPMNENKQCCGIPAQFLCCCDRLAAAERERDDMQRVFDLQHKRTIKADKLWQTAHGKPDVFPDLGELIEWLLMRAEAAEREVERLKAECLRLIEENERLDNSSAKTGRVPSSEAGK